MNKKHSLSDRWERYCEKVAFRLLKEHEVPLNTRGTPLLLAALFRRIGKSLTFSRKTRDDKVDIEPKGFSKFTELLEWTAWRVSESFSQTLDLVGKLLKAIFFPESLANAMKRRASKRTIDVEAKGFGKFTESMENLAWQTSMGVRGAASLIYKLIVPEKLIKRIENALYDAATATFKFISTTVTILVRRFVPPWLRAKFGFLTTGYNAVSEFTLAWGKSRSWSKLFKALPAFCLVTPLVVAIASGLAYTPGAKKRYYQKALVESIDEGDQLTEQLCLAKLSQLGYHQIERMKFRAAHSMAEREGNWEEAYQQIKPLADISFGPAHLWIAQQLLLGRIDVADRWEQIESHAKRALEQFGIGDENARNLARAILARVMVQRGETTKATLELDDLAKSMPTLHFELMLQRVKSGDSHLARRHAEKVIRICEQMASDERVSTMSEAYYLAWAMALELTGKSAEAEGVLGQGVSRFPSDQRLSSRLGTAYARKLDNALLLGQLRLTEEPAQELLQGVLRYDPDNKLGLELLAELAGFYPEQAANIANALRDKDQLQVETCLALGDIRWMKDDPKGAVAYYEMATELDKSNPTAWNNVAWIRASIPAALDLHLALRAVNQAIELNPKPAYYETRGQIYAKLKRWEEAVTDLERAIRGSLSNSKEAHATLAKALAAIGRNEAAAAHRQKAELLLAPTGT